MGHVDRKLGNMMLVTALIGVRLAVWVNESLFHIKKGTADPSGGSVIADLYISALFIVILSIISIFLLRDVLGTEESGDKPATGLADFLSRIKLPPMVTLKISDVRISFWIIALVGLLNGYLAGAIGVGGFVGVPAMIYAFGIPTAVAAGTQLYLAIFMGAFGAINYALAGMVDLRLTFLLYVGSLTGIYIGAYGTRVVHERIIRLVTGMVILICVVSRAVNVPVYLGRLNILHLSAQSSDMFSLGSKVILYISGLSGMAVILSSVAKAYRRRRRAKQLIKGIAG